MYGGPGSLTFTTPSKLAERARTLCADVEVRIMTTKTVELRAGSATLLEKEVEPTSWLKVVRMPIAAGFERLSFEKLRTV